LFCAGNLPCEKSHRQARMSSDDIEAETFRTLAKPASAEFVGSIFFLFLAIGMASSTADFGAPGDIQVGIALCFGFCIFTVAFTIGHISGGHLNPAVTIAFMFLRKVSILRGAMYFGAQLTGMLVGVAFLRLWLPPRFQLACLAANNLGVGVTPGGAFGVEFICTMFLMTVISAASDINKGNTTLVPFAIGTAVTCAHFMSISITGTSMNPTRSFASAFDSLGLSGCSSVWPYQWIFWLAPILGAITGAVIYEYAFTPGFRLRNTLLFMYTKKAAMPGYVDRFKKTREAVSASKAAQDDEPLDE